MTDTDKQNERLDKGYPYALRPELHEALIARGIDYWVADGITFWNRDDGCECLAYGYKADGVPKLAIKVVGFTDPEQAIAATLGRGTCHMRETTLPFVSDGNNDGYYMICSECGFAIYMRRIWAPLKYCSNCGRKVVDE